MENTNVPYIAYEGSMARYERQCRRLVIALVVAIVLIFATNAIWLWAWCQYDYTGETTTTETVTVDGKDGIANYANNGGSVVNGADTQSACYYPSQDEDTEAGW